MVGGWVETCDGRLVRSTTSLSKTGETGVLDKETDLRGILPQED